MAAASPECGCVCVCVLVSMCMCVPASTYVCTRMYGVPVCVHELVSACVPMCIVCMHECLGVCALCIYKRGQTARQLLIKDLSLFQEGLEQS